MEALSRAHVGALSRAHAEALSRAHADLAAAESELAEAEMSMAQQQAHTDAQALELQALRDAHAASERRLEHAASEGEAEAAPAVVVQPARGEAHLGQQPPPPTARARCTA